MKTYFVGMLMGIPSYGMLFYPFGVTIQLIGLALIIFSGIKMMKSN